MPTSYTADIYEGKDISFEDFILRCARQFGANIRMRDDSFTAEIVEYEPETKYHEENIANAHKSLAELDSMSPDKIQSQIDKSFAASLKSHEEYAAKKEALRSRYEAMIQRVESWDIPTDEHVNLKEFALTQLKESLEFDCSSSMSPPTLSTVEEYVASQRDHYNWNIDYHTRKLQEEIERVEKSNKWNNDLKNSLKAMGN